ncbi:hypothetical protein CLOBY_03830 [Clostridium saccharobutylicum]|uniref:hypothetical protein n=1 Tax=Clostridium saccharobutylicum TaxID=169679 RepID=UPI0009839B49|nr:hypothetical protein [Clostridium saccharobutylicum]AQS08311.1 hypothetical protein CLOBY_03830 [Clostridium saccharobutylicum]MBC2435802.1 hypothetical protein [Clostridium saccharobutylicum]NSB88325.1 hypothetical protein [Clostridium saccharobutylicum]NYC29362.1 hypothetical protein [Clostridium saccharobutylicum]OOM10891.1 hypothetical protein CLSAB_42740 [Clostridium saccharobutylicum]
MLKEKLILIPEEESGCKKYDFTSVQSIQPTYGFSNTFGEEYTELSILAIKMIIERYGNSAEYLQIFKYNGIEFWVINDENTMVTLLLPSEY